MTAPAGRYRDAHGVQRWWDGSRWTDVVRPPAPYASAVPARVAQGTPTNTVWIWLAVEAQAALFAFAIFASIRVWPQMQDLLFAVKPGSGKDTATVFQLEAALFANPWYIANLVFPFVACGASVWFAYLDRGELQHRGFDRPFHWAWALAGLPMYACSLAYAIGRAIVIRRRGGRAAAPMVAAILIQVAGLAAVIMMASAWVASVLGMG